MRNRISRIMGALLILGLIGIFVYLARNWTSPFLQSRTALVLLFALFFPGTAILYFYFELNVRRDEIMGAVEDNSLYRIYYPNQTAAEGRRQFTRLVNRRFHQYYPAMELGTLAVFAGVLTFVCAMVISILFVSDGQNFLALENFKAPAPFPLQLAAGFLGGLSGAYTLILRKYRSFDLYPSTYFQASIGIVLGVLVGAFVVPALGVLPQQVSSSGVLMAVAFAVGFFAAKQVDYVEGMLGDLLKTYQIKQPPEAVASDLGAVIRNPAAIDSLVNLGLASISEVAKATPLVLYLNLPQPIGVINGWIDEMLLHYYFGPWAPNLNEAGVRRFAQLVERFAPGLAVTAGKPVLPRNIVWAPAGVVVTGDAPKDAALYAAVREIVESEIHHTMLAMIWTMYRQTFFAGITEDDSSTSRILMYAREEVETLAQPSTEGADP